MYIVYVDGARSQKLPLNDSKWLEVAPKFNENFIKSHKGKVMKDIFLKMTFCWNCCFLQFPENLHDFHNDLSFFTQRMKIAKVENLVANLHDKQKFVVHTRNLKVTLNHGLVLKWVHRISKFN